MKQQTKHETKFENKVVNDEFMRQWWTAQLKKIREQKARTK